MNRVRQADQYRLSFTSGGLYLYGAPTAARLFLDVRNWATVRSTFDDNNILQARTAASAKRGGRELVQRLEELTFGELEILIDATAEERAHLMWTATCRRYELIGDFADEVLRQRFLLLALDVKPEHFETFIRGKAMWHDELNQLATSTMTKLRTSLFLMMREANFLTEDGVIIPTLLSNRVQIELTKRIPSDVRFFPTREIS